MPASTPLEIAGERITRARLENLEILDLSGLGLETLPPEIGECSELKRLLLKGNRLIKLPLEMLKLEKLENLHIQKNLLDELPAEISGLISLKNLYARGNKITSLPEEFGRLTSLRELSLQENRLKDFPLPICKLDRLESLTVSGNEISELPNEINNLESLVRIDLTKNVIECLPEVLGGLRSLEYLSLRRNPLLSLPPSIGELRSLRLLNLNGGRLSQIPAEIGKLTKLRRLDLRGTLVDRLPVEILECPVMREGLTLPNPKIFRFPPSDVARMGIKAIRRYLEAAREGAETIWESKLLIVGEGSVGKTWLCEALNGRMCGGQHAKGGATVGIEIGSLRVKHPENPNVEMHLKCWDFAGQDVTHATHQFFFSERTLFLVCWNARAGWEAGKLRKWLTNIRDRAPGATVILVATQCDEPHSDYPEIDLRSEFMQIKDAIKVSSVTGENIARLQESIARLASRLPMMGLAWPLSWRGAQEAVQALRSKGPYAQVESVIEMICECGLGGEDAELLLRWLHELGEVLHYSDVPDLSGLVMLDPQWVTKHVGDVLASRDVQAAGGVLTRECVEQLWPNASDYVRHHLLGMMDRFDLAYRIPEDEEDRSLVVERLSQNPPDYQTRWQTAASLPQVRLRYKLGAMHPGIPTWFFARCHRFTLGLHWLRGVLFGDERHSPRHLALIVANDAERTVEFTVRGPRPWTFLPLLTDGFEDTVTKRYPGLSIERFAPCPGMRPDGSMCEYQFKVDLLEKRRWPGDPSVKAREIVECLDCGTTLRIDELLLGLSHEAATEVVGIDDIQRIIKEDGDKTRSVLTQEFVEVRQFIQREFVREWNKQQESEDHSVPTVFAVYPVDGSTFTKRTTFKLQLYCMAPDCWHSIGSDGACQFTPNREVLVTIARWARTSIKWIRPVAMILPGAVELMGEWGESLGKFADGAKNELKLTADIFKELKHFEGGDGEGDEETFALSTHGVEHRGEFELRELKGFLQKMSFPRKPFGGLKRVRTAEGHWLWLCEKHAGQFVRSG